VLHGKVDGAFETRVARVHHFLGEAIERLLDIEIVVRIVQIVVSEP